MNERLKHRLVGAVVLVSFAVVVVPMVLKPPSDTENPLSQPSVIHRAQGSFDSRKRASGVPHRGQPGETNTSLTVEPHQGRVAAGGSDLPNKGDKPISPEGAFDAEREVQGSQTDERTPLRADGTRISESKGEVLSSTAASEGKIRPWVVQLGSFSKRSNAVRLRNRLKALGHPAFVKPTAPRDAGLTRVYVGPRSSKGKARQLSRTLGKETQLTGLVVPYP
jgi:DedD protein